MEILKILLKPFLHAREYLIEDGTLRHLPETTLASMGSPIKDQPHARCVKRAGDNIHQSSHPLRLSPPHREIEDLLRQLRNSLHDGGPPGNHHPGGHRIVIARLLDLTTHQRKDLFHPRL